MGGLISEALARAGWGDRAQLGLTFSLLVLTAIYLWFNGLYFFASDYLAGFYPFHAYPQFSGSQGAIQNGYYQDVSFFFFPFWEFAGEQLSRGVLPLWNPLEGGGHPAAATHALGSMFPLRWLIYSLLPSIGAWQLELALIFVTGSISAYYFFKNVTGDSQGATIGALSWVLAGGFGTYFQQGTVSWPLAFLPLTLLSLIWLERGKPFGFAVASLATGGCWLVGHLQYSPIIFFICLLFALLREEARWKKVGALFIGLFISLPYLVPLVELVTLSKRQGLAPEVTAGNLLALREYLTLLFPLFCGAPNDGFYLGRDLSQQIINGREHCLYIGQLSVLLAVFGAWRQKSVFHRCLTAVILSGFIVAGSAFLYLGLTKLLPPLGQVTPLRFLPFLHFGSCYFAALGWKELKERAPTKEEVSIGAAILASALLAVLSFVLPATMQSGSFVIWLASLVKQSGITKPPYFEGAFGEYILTKMVSHFQLSSVAIWLPILTLCAGLIALFRWKAKARFQLVLLILLVDLLFYFFQFNIPTAQAKFYPTTKEIELLKPGHQLSEDGESTPSRVMSLGKGLHPNILLAYGVANFEAYASIMPGDYRRIFRYLNGEKRLAHQLASLTSPELLKAGALDIFGVTTLYNDPSPEALSEEGPHLLILPPRTTALRAFLSNRWEVNNDYTAIFQNGFDPRNNVLLERSCAVKKGDFFQQVSPTYYGCNLVSFTLDSQESALLVLNDLHYPGWTAKLNGEEIPILKAYGFCRAVEVPKGSSNLEFTYRPTGWNWTLPACYGALFLSIVMPFVFRKRAQ